MNVDHPTLNAISLCSGVGMLDEGFHAGLGYLGIRSRTVLYAEREAYPVAVLEARMEEGSIHPAPIWFGDFTELPARQFRGVVDFVVAGFPCQDLSVAGKRAGLDGKRSGLFFEVVRIATDSGAWGMLLENVAGIATATATVVDAEEGELDERAASRVVGELADLGWNAEWIVISASDVGASHGRARWFCVAWRELADSKINGRDQGRPESGGEQRRPDASECSLPMGNSGLQHIDIQQRTIRPEHTRASNSMAHRERERLQRSERNRETGEERESCGYLGECNSAVADSVREGCQRNKQSARIGKDGRTDGRSRNHADQLPNFIMMNFSHPAPATQDGQTSSENTPNSRRHLEESLIPILLNS